MHANSIDPKTSPILAASKHDAAGRNSSLSDTTLLAADYGFLPKTHPIAQNLNERLARLFPDLPTHELPEVKVLASLGQGLNAFCLPDGLLVVTPETLTTLKFEEEIDAILKHEGIHRRHQHIAESQALAEGDGSVSELVGVKRLHEYEADALSFLEMADPRSHTNPFGYLSLLETVRELPGQAQNWDPDHGRLTDRILNLRVVVGSYELSPGTNPLDHLSERPLTPIDPTIREQAQGITAQGGKIGQLLVPPSSDPRHLESWVDTIRPVVVEAIAKHDLPLLIAAADQLTPKLAQLLKHDRPGNTGSSTNSIRYQASYRLLEALHKNIETIISGYIAQSPLGPTSEFGKVITGTIAGLLLSPDLCKALNRRHTGTGLQPLPSALDFMMMADSLTPADLPAIPRMSRYLLNAGIALPAESCSRLVLALSTHLLIENAAFDTDEDEGPDLREFWNATAPALLEACRVDAEQMRFSAQRFNRKISQELTNLVKNSLKAKRELLQQSENMSDVDDSSFNPYKVPLSPHEEAALLELCADSNRLGASIVLSSLAGPLPVLRHVATEIEALQERAERCAPQELDTLIAESIRLVRSLPVDFQAPLRVTRDNGNQEATTLTYDSKETKISADTVARALAHRVISRLDTLDPRQLATGVKLTQYLSPSSGPLEDVYAFHLLFSRLPLERLVELPREISQILATPDAKDSWNEFPSTGFEHRGAHEVIAKLQISGLLGISEPSRFFDYLQKALRYISTSDMALNRRSALFNHSLDLLSRLPASEQVYGGYLASHLIFDSTVNQRIRAGFLDQMARTESIARMVEVTTTQFAEHGPHDFLQVLNILDQRATNPTEHDLIFDTLSKLTTSFRKHTMKAASAVVGAELVNQLNGFSDRQRATKILLTSQQDDGPLRRSIAEYWTDAYYNQIKHELSELAGLGGGFNEFVDRLKETELLSEKSLLRNELQTGLPELERLLCLPTPEGLLQALYTLSNQQRLVIARELLIGTKGLLTSTEGRHALHQMLVETSLEGDAGSQVVSDAISALLKVGATDDLAEGLIPVLADRICRPPTEDPGWGKHARKALRTSPLVDQITHLWSRARTGQQSEVQGEAVTEALIKEGLLSDRLSNRSRGLIMNRVASFQDYDPKKGLTPESVRNFFDTPHGRRSLKILSNEKRSQLLQKLLTSAIKDVLARAMSRTYRLEEADLKQGLETLERLSKPRQPVAPDGKRNSIDFIVQFGPKMGSPTVRAAQVGAQLLSLSPVDQRKLLGVFDSTEPQLACSAWSTLRRAEPAIADALTQFGPRIGGGSLNSVFYAQHPDFGPAVVKVLVPQAARRATSTLALMKETQRAMEYDNSAYTAGRQLVELTGNWIGGELGDTNFDTHDTAFRTRFHGCSYAGLDIYIPKRLHTRTATVRIEEFVDGHNLSKLEEMEPALAKRAVAAGFQCYIDQISGTTMDNVMGRPVLVLADISPGNARVTRDGKRLAILDRPFYQEITFEDRWFLKALSTANDPERLAKTITDYFKTVEGAPSDLEAAQDRLTDRLRKRFGGARGESLISSITVDAYAAGFTFPLRLQLIARGFAAWSHMAQMAGFSSLQEAQRYKGES